MIHPLALTEVDELVAYLVDHLRDNGRNGTPLFQPVSRDHVVDPVERAAAFRRAMEAPVAQPGWRRFWIARSQTSGIAGHVDLRAHPEPSTSHRALLGMGVHRDHRRTGLGRRLVDFALSWAEGTPSLSWVDLSHLAGNDAANRLYARAGFTHVATIREKFLVDGAPVDDVLMTKRLRT